MTINVHTIYNIYYELHELHELQKTHSNYITINHEDEIYNG